MNDDYDAPYLWYAIVLFVIAIIAGTLAFAFLVPRAAHATDPTPAPYVVNPKGTNAIMQGRAIVQNNTGPCLNLHVFSSVPGMNDGDLAIVDDGALTHQICFQGAGTVKCADATTP